MGWGGGFHRSTRAGHRVWYSFCPPSDSPFRSNSVMCKYKWGYIADSAEDNVAREPVIFFLTNLAVKQGGEMTPGRKICSPFCLLRVTIGIRENQTPVKASRPPARVTLTQTAGLMHCCCKCRWRGLARLACLTCFVFGAGRPDHLEESCRSGFAPPLSCGSLHFYVVDTSTLPNPPPTGLQPSFQAADVLLQPARGERSTSGRECWTSCLNCRHDVLFSFTGSFFPA